MPANPDQLNQLRAVQTQINAYPYVADNPVFDELPDTWKFAVDGKGFECRDYTEAKAAELQKPAYGSWPQSALSCVLCYDELGDYHAVLAVEAGGETFILDNRTADVYRWDEPVYPYKWALRQVAGTDGFRDVSWA